MKQMPMQDRIIPQLYKDQVAGVPSTQASISEALGVPVGMVSRALSIRIRDGMVIRGCLTGAPGTRGSRVYHLTDAGRHHLRELQLTRVMI
jgi:hypothetical protein